MNSEELSLIKSSPLPPQLPAGREEVNSTQLFGPMNSSKISPLKAKYLSVISSTMSGQKGGDSYELSPKNKCPHSDLAS